MKTKTVIWIIAAAALTVIGAMIVSGALNAAGWDISKLSTVKYETNEHLIDKDYERISIRTSTSDIVFVPSENGETSVECFEKASVKHSVTVQDGTLIISEAADTRKWYEYIGISFSMETPKITVSLPLGEYGALSVSADTGDVVLPEGLCFDSIDVSESTGDVECHANALGEMKIKTSTGNILLEDLSAGSLDLSSSTGNVTLSNLSCTGDARIVSSTGNAVLKSVNCKSLTSSASTGDLILEGFTASKKLSVERSTGDVRLKASDAAEIFIETDTGDVTGSLLSEKIFLTETDTGDVDVPRGTGGGRCEITTDTGDIEISITSID